MIPWRFVLLLALALLALPARAQTIRHCIGSDGHPVFTDQPCSSLQAVPAPATSAATEAPADRAPAVTCATSVEQLREAMVDAFASGDANRLGGLMLWAGYGEHAVVADLRGLATWLKRPLVDVQAEGDPSAGDDAASALVVRTLAADGSGNSDSTRFAIERHAGCLWLHRP